MTWISRVYPRACGGTVERFGSERDDTGLSPRVRGNPFLLSSTGIANGLSPRVRGNHERQLHAEIQHGSIPARAGEPDRLRYRHSRARVYPRACGGTWPPR